MPVLSPSTSDGRRHMRRKDFHYKHGHKHHSYDNDKAPYPLSYDKHVLEIESLDNKLIQFLRKSVSFVNFDHPPKRVLDLGCGLGTWVIDAAKEWPDASLVGFDLVDIQVPLKVLHPSIADRIEWRHGNFLTTKLPFDDDEFDHVHVQSIAKGVPEHKWGVLFEEINRVLKPDGSIEILEDDILFPSLPRWFTEALRARPLRDQSVHYPPGSIRRNPTPSLASSTSSNTSHDHALLESLYMSVFEHRFINMRPSSLIPNYLSTYFRQVIVGPVTSFPMPPLPPLQPLPPQMSTSYIAGPDLDLLDNNRTSTMVSTSSFSRPVSLSFSSYTSYVNDSKSSTNSRPRTSSAPLSYSSGVSTTSTEDDQITLVDHPPQKFILESRTEDIRKIHRTLISVEQLDSLNERSLAMQLYRNYQSVLGCQEAMWEELKDRIRNRKDGLVPFGWEDDEELEEMQSRKKFERLIERYRSDMQARVSLWCSLDGLGWPIPTREPLSKAELIEEERLRESMLEARKLATPDEMMIPSRICRVGVGFKV